MSESFVLQLALYEVLDIIPFVVLAVVPFRSKIRSPRIIVCFTVVLYLLGFVRRILSLAFPPLAGVLSLLWAVIYLLLYHCAIRERLSKLLFVLITVLNYASMAAILYNYVGFRLFGNFDHQSPYGIEVSISAIFVLAVTYPVMIHWFLHRVSPLMEEPERVAVWKTLWLVPLTFCVIFYYSLYTSGSIYSFSIDTQNLFFSLVVSAGTFFVLSLMLQLVEVNVLTLHLQSENHQMEMNMLQFQSLAEQIETARQARHDQRQLIHVLQVYLKDGNVDHLRCFVEKICSATPTVPVLVYCRHLALNALLCNYADSCAHEQIDFTAQIDFPAQVGIEDVDVIVLFGNLLENAYEACNRQRSDNRFIHLKVGRSGSQIVLLLDNSFEGTIRRDGDSFLSSKHAGNGIGTASVRRIILKYQGTVNFHYDGTVFRISARLNDSVL